MPEFDVPVNELDSLKARADLLGISYHPSIGLDKLREKVNAAVADKPVAQEAKQDKPADVDAPKVVHTPEEAEALRLVSLRNEQLALKRIRVTCMNPNKSEWDGEIFTVGNALVGAITKFVPFNADDGWHVPQILLDTLQDRQCQVFVTHKAKNGVTVRQGKLIKEFAIEILPPLSADELHDLAQRQAMAGAGE